MIRKQVLILILTIAPGFFASAERPIVLIGETSKTIVIGEYLEIFKDDKGLDFSEVLIQQDAFIRSSSKIPNVGIFPANIWLRFTVKNESSQSDFLLNLEYPIIDEVEFFYPDVVGNYSSIALTEQVFENRKYNDPDYIFDLDIQPGETKMYYMRVNGMEQIILPLSVNVPQVLWEQKQTKTLLNGIYIGVILITFFYNLFVWFSVRDRSYLFYVLYVVFIGLTQINIKGISLNYLFPELTVHGRILTVYAALACLFGLFFTKSFLQTKIYARKLDYGLTLLIFPLAASLLLTVFRIDQPGFLLMQLSTSLFSIYVLVVSFYLLFKGYQQAKYFSLAWSVLLIGAIIFLLKDYGVLPYNNITNYAMQAASAIEMALLSFALADRINIFRKEAEQAQIATLKALEENARIVKEQNLLLEQKVEERTQVLNHTLNTLKDAQAQLVESEKMASLGQLTAGIAHEINNPINFVSSNIMPLRRDMEDIQKILRAYEEMDVTNVKEKLKAIAELKKELDFEYLKEELKQIISGIEEGATRTTEIVHGLQTFSRSDEKELKEADINEGIRATTTLIKNKLDGIKLEINLGDIPAIECYPGKLNQVFMNIINNAIQAIEERHKNRMEGNIEIRTRQFEDNIEVCIKDNGIGMNEEVKQKVFEPFFTTKAVGAGTGLGMAISYKIISAHGGKIRIESEQNKGTEFIIQIPITRN